MKGLTQDQHNRLKNSKYLEFRLLATRWRFVFAPALLVVRAVVMMAFLFMTPLIVIAAVFCGIFDALVASPGLIYSFLWEKWSNLKQIIKYFLPIIVGKK